MEILLRIKHYKFYLMQTDYSPVVHCFIIIIEQPEFYFCKIMLSQQLTTEKPLHVSSKPDIELLIESLSGVLSPTSVCIR